MCNIMTKVGIVSCYFQKNYGSALQALATQMILDRLGYENETINISGFNDEIKKSKIKYFTKAVFKSDILLHKFGMAKNVLIKKFSNGEYVKSAKKRNVLFENFVYRYFRLSEVYASKKELSEKCKENYSTVIVGSDQLWLPANIAADYYTLSFVPDGVNTISYATSFGISKLPSDTENKASNFLRKIKHLSVREESGKKIIKDITGRNVPVVCDPTLLFTGDEWMCIQKEKPIIDVPYILCYFLGNNPSHRVFATKLKEKTGADIIAFPHLDEYIKSDEKYADKMLYDVDPSDFINLIRNAKYVCTDSFHCTVFSVLYKKKFFTFRRYARKTKQSTNSRIDSLFNALGIKDCIFTGEEDINTYINPYIDYDKVYGNLDVMRQKSYKYLIEALEDRGSTDL